MDATGDVEGGAGSQDSDRSSNRVDDDEKTDPNAEEEEDPNLLIVCVVIGLLLLLILVAASLSLLCLYKRHRHRLNCFHSSTLDADTDRLRRLTTGSDQASTSASASDATPVDASKRKSSSSGEQTGSRLIPKFLFSSARSSTNQSATGTGSYGTIPTSTCPSGIGFPVPTKVSYVLLSNKSVESPESNPTSPEVVDASRPPNDPNSRIIRNRAAITGSQPGNAAVSSRRSKVMGTLSSRGSNPNANPPPPATVASSPCRIVVDAVVFTAGDDDPPSSASDLNKRFIVDSTSNTSTSAAAAAAASAAATAESRRSSYSSVIGFGFGFGGGAGDGATDAASRRGSMSPRERSSIPFLWTLGPSSSAPSVGKEDSFWVPPTVLLKKRANSLAPPSLTVTADVDSGGSHHNGTAPRRSESVGRGGGSEVCGGGGARGGPGQSNSASGRDMSSLTCSSTDRLSETWPSGEWTNGQQQQQQHHPHHQQQMQQQQLQQQRRRRASMQDALDFTKIDASLYERPPPLSCSQKLFGSVQEENLGSVHFSLTYDADLSVLTVRLMQAMDLSMPSPAPPPSPAPSTAAGGSAPTTVGGPGDSGPPRLLNPYARLRLLPDERNVLQSRIHHRTLCPQFEEEFVFEATPTDLANRTLELMLMNDEHGGGGGGGCSARSVAASLAAAAASGSAAEEDEGCFFGHVLLPLDQVDFTEPTTFLKGISAYERKPEPESYLGDIMFSLSYLPSAERMTVVITKARHLKQADLSASRTPPALNPFVKVIVFTEGKKVKKKKTTTKRGSACPEWNEALVFGVAKDLLGGVQLEFLVLSENLLGTDDTIGKVVLGARSTGDDRAHWNDFLNGKPGISRWHRLVPSDA